MRTTCQKRNMIFFLLFFSTSHSLPLHTLSPVRYRVLMLSGIHGTVFFLSKRPPKKSNCRRLKPALVTDNHILHDASTYAHISVRSPYVLVSGTRAHYGRLHSPITYNTTKYNGRRKKRKNFKLKYRRPIRFFPNNNKKIFFYTFSHV